METDSLDLRAGNPGKMRARTERTEKTAKEEKRKEKGGEKGSPTTKTKGKERGNDTSPNPRTAAIQS